MPDLATKNKQEAPLRLPMLEAVVKLFTDGVIHGRKPTEDEYMKVIEQSIARYAGPSN